MTISPAISPTRPRPLRGTLTRSLRLISLFKWVQAVVVSGGAFATLHLLRPAVTASIRTWIGRLPYEAQERFTARALSALLNHPPGHTRLFAFAALGCALLFAVEGTGLWLGHRWAEWLTVIATGSLIPFELWELFRHPGVVKVFIVLLNIVVVWFLSAHLRAPRVVPASR